MKAVIIGGSGATGKELIKNLLNDEQFQEITLLVRQPIVISHHKLKQVVVDFNQLDSYQNEIKGDIAFSCLGTTLKIAGSKEKQWEIDYEYQYKFAEICKANSVSTFVLISSKGANPTSSIFYSKMKGELDLAIKNLNFNRAIIILPGSLIRPNTDRSIEKISIRFLNLLNSLGLFKTFQPLHVSEVAECMKYFSINSQNGYHKIEMPQILKHLKYLK